MEGILHFCGDGRIRTCGHLSDAYGLAIRCFRPLSHISINNKRPRPESNRIYWFCRPAPNRSATGPKVFPKGFEPLHYGP